MAFHSLMPFSWCCKIFILLLSNRSLDSIAFPNDLWYYVQGDFMFSSRLRNLRTQRGITQAELATSIGVSSGTITMWETGKREPKYDKLSLIANFFECSIDYLLGHADDTSAVQNSKSESWHPLGESCQNTILMYLRLDGIGKTRADAVIHNEFNRCEQAGNLKPEEDFSLTIFRK